jgi:homoserine O-acetyltransferase
MISALMPLVTVATVEAQPAPQVGTPLERHEFVIRDFRTESGVVLPEAHVVYSTLGTLNARGDNAILLPSHYMANFNGYNWLIKGSDPNRVFDPSRDFLILTELFGNGRSSSPSNTPEPFHGPRFPVMTIRDNVDAVHRLVTTQLGVLARRGWILDGRRTGVSVGRQPSRLHGCDRRHLRDGEMLWPRLRAAGRPDRRADHRSRMAGR